jgi:hypothetical protein
MKTDKKLIDELIDAANDWYKLAKNGSSLESDQQLEKLTTHEKALLQRIQKYKSIKSKIISLLMDDAYCISFQTIGQYRSALVKEIDKL